jgi:hypothetical protein
MENGMILKNLNLIHPGDQALPKGGHSASAPDAPPPPPFENFYDIYIFKICSLNAFYL